MILTPIAVTDIHASELPMYRRFLRGTSNAAEEYFRVEYQEFLVAENLTPINIINKVFVLKNITDGYQGFTDFLSQTANDGETQLQFLARILANIFMSLPSDVPEYFEVDEDYIS